jgi:hypothetical protein
MSSNEKSTNERFFNNGGTSKLLHLYFPVDFGVLPSDDLITGKQKIHAIMLTKSTEKHDKFLK